MKKIIAAASVGGHWIQLGRIMRGMNTQNVETVYASTHEGCEKMVTPNRFYKLEDFNRWNAYKVFPAFFRAISILRKERPDAVVTTGAAPGLIMVAAARLCGCKTVWIDSIANVERMSMCGRIATKIAHKVYTQWPELAQGKVVYAGNVLS